MCTTRYRDNLGISVRTDEGSFKAYAPYLGEAFDRGTKATQLAEAKLGSEGLGMWQEDAKADTLEEYVVVLPFELP
ncbi:hypothetical protein B296_00021483 [Ensete ventricosum]|uniref:Uncharacterized protein n=1 Tax=Ensete ventricosum TaxID=4639 RepID=A0A427AYN1_ENSVE|nr:hypothetical protein B296_00021483 [Ensete ventricosum]